MFNYKYCFYGNHLLTNNALYICNSPFIPAPPEGEQVY